MEEKERIRNVTETGQSVYHYMKAWRLRWVEHVYKYDIGQQ